MMALLNEIIRIHADTDDRIWFASQDQLPISSSCSMNNFIRNMSFKPDNVIQILATQDNIKLILQIYNLKLSGQIANLQVGSPIIASERPEISLLDAAKLDGLPASLGGWHDFTEHDYPAYYLARHYANNVSHDILSNILKLHPVWHSLTFVPHLNEEKCGRLIALILDPRWYIDEEEPEKNSKLEAFLGLTPNTMNRVLNNTQPDKNSSKNLFNKCKLVLEAWRSGKPTSTDDMQEPNNFLWRISESDNSATSILRASQAFVAFLKNLWLDEIYKKKTSISKDGYFIPEYFFMTKLESDAFKEYVKLQR